MAIKSHKLGPGSLTFGETASLQEFGSQLRSCSLTPDTEEEDPIPVLSGEELAGDEETLWNISGAVLDDYSMTSLAVWANTNKGVEMPFEFQPNAETGSLTVKGTVKIRPIALGGDVKARNENDFEFKLVGDPVFSATV